MSAEIATAQHEAMEEKQFAQAFFSRENPFTWIFFGMNIAVFLLTCLAGGQGNDVLIPFGAKLNSLINAGQYWRLVTPIFLHGGLIHLAVNSYALYALAPSVERLYGSPKFVLLYLGSGIASIAASYLLPWVNVDAPSVGASGALFGLIGVLTVFGFKYRDELPGQFKKAFGARLIPVIVLNLVIGLVIPIVDNSAHLGGLIAGGILASVIPFKRQGSRDNEYVWKGVQVLILGFVLFCFIKTFRSYNGPHLSARTFRADILPMIDETKGQAMLNGLNESSKSFARAFNNRDPEATASGLEALKKAPDILPDSTSCVIG